MICPKCKKDVLGLVNTSEEIITPYRNSQDIFPISIMVTNFWVYKCDCGVSIKLPEIKHYKKEE
jgi:hypothetical protein